EAAFVEALVDHMVPADELTPKGTELGINIYIDRALAGAWGKGDRLYMQGPWKRGTPNQGYQLPLTPAQLYRAGIEATNAYCRKTYGGKSFDRLDEKQREEVLTGFAGGKIAFDNGLPARTFWTTVYPAALERGGVPNAAKDFAVPNIRDELRYVIRHEMMQNAARDTLTIRNNPSQEALPMRRLGSFLPGEGAGGSGNHWSGHTWRWTDMEFKVRSMYEERYGKNFIPADMTIQDWGITYDELEPYYDKYEYTAAVSGKAGNLKGQIQRGGNPLQAPRALDESLPKLTPILASAM